MTEELFRNTQVSMKVAALRFVDLPLSVYCSLPQIGSLKPITARLTKCQAVNSSHVSLSTGTKKLFAATAFGAVSLIYLARRFRRRKGKKKATSSVELETFELLSTAPLKKESECLNLLLNSKNCYTCNVVSNGSLFSKLSSSLPSLASMRSRHSSSSSTCANDSSCWDGAGDDGEICSLLNIPVTTPENLYLMGMELFEEALRRWEQALTFRSRQTEDDENYASVKLGAGDAIAEESMEDIISVEFIRKLESLLQRAYRLQEEFEGALGMTEPSTHPNNDKHMDLSVREDLEDTCLRDSISIASTDSFVSAAELSEHREMRSAHVLGSLCHHLFYEDALQMAEEGKISCRVLRTEMLECLGDTDFLAKLHCIRQACQVILCERATRAFLADIGKRILSSIIVKARKSPKRFEEVFEEMICFLEQTDHWENTEIELSARGVKHLNFFDIVLDFILMDSFEDLENPPISIQNVVNNRWLNNSFKETAVASSCWSVLKQKRQHMKVPDGFIAHFYAVCEHISPVLAWGFLGPKSSLNDFCCFFKEQVLFFMKDIFDLDKVRYSSLDTLAEDILHLLHRRSELLLAYVGTDIICHLNGCSGTPLHLLPSALLEAQVQ
ncbi:mitoguardin 1 isoform X1 [Puntigrus tetrazona]|uniref:mitoguardin 1 isoform X1 n=1 Tax=Puntigrus tetrazona TaxID=1606681 RepID=UPI001C8A50EB|nr:mitoguardin 1 isoform X1 [Puntigrus tetrazona]XP_043113321.1 mitoguardin 1 isoform X1 [Puntigrus tetrazona]XP_043113328.1 mitoguardin 1 isoform X1 [Puntigrus tetrazona]